MNIIDTYLDNMFNAYPQTARLVAAKAELRAMMEDAYAAHLAKGASENEAVGKVISDFGNIDEVAPVLGITGDIAPKTLGTDAAAAAEPSAPAYEPVTLDEARGYAEAKRSSAGNIAAGIALFIFSPAALIFLSVASEAGVMPWSENTGIFIGLAALGIMVALGVAQMIAASRKTSRYARIEKKEFTRNPVVTHWAEALVEQHETARSRALQIAVGLWILAPVVLIGVALLTDGDPRADLIVIVSVVVLLAIVALGFMVFLPKNWARSTLESLTADPSDDEDSLVGVIAGIYWPLLAVIFLAWGFIANAWDRAWIVWPTGAVLFGAIVAAVSGIEGYRKSKRR